MTGGGLQQPTVALQDAPVRHTEKERLTWERELLGLYISAHPLDQYATYLEEQTVPISQMTSDIDGRKMTIGGIVAAVRSIVTKSGSKMAFVRIEDKFAESELIIFPNLYEQIGADLVQDAIIRATGKVSARDRDGNITSDVKMIADEVQIVSDEEIRSYEAHGSKMQKPKTSRRLPTPNQRAKNDFAKKTASAATVAQAETQPTVSVSAEPLRKLYVHVKNPDDQSALLSIKQVCELHPGLGDVVLVLGEDKRSAIKMPFRVDGNDALVGELVKILGEDAVVLK